MSDPNQAFYDSIPDAVPKTSSPRFTRFCRWLINRLGWRFLGEVPAEQKVIGVIGPHTSNIDFLLLVLTKYATGIGASYIMKKEAFFWPFKKLFIDIGGVPIDRSHPIRVITQVTSAIRNREKMWIVITPEGTRKKVQKYKTGFARMATAADVPIVVIGFNYQNKTLSFDKTYKVSDQYDIEASELRDYIRANFVGRYPDQQ